MKPSSPTAVPRSPTPAAHGRLPVLFLARNLLVGGAERTFVNYVNHLQSLDPIVVLLQREGALLSELRTDVPCHELATRAAGGSESLLSKSVAVLREARRLAAIAASSGAGAVSTFLMRSHLVGLSAKLLFDWRLKVVLNVHEMMSESADYLYPTRNERLLMEAITRHLFPRADLIVVVAEGMKRDLVTHFGVPADKITIVNNPIDTAAVRQRACEAGDSFDPPHGRYQVVGVGRLVKLKGFDVLIRAFARLPRALDATLVLVGEGAERTALESLRHQLGLEDRVFLIGRQRNPWRHMAGADVVVVPSFTEAFPNVIGEALALGRPVLATNCSAGVREYLENGRCGVLVPPGDEEALARGLERLLTDDSLRHELAIRGPARVAAFDLPRTIRAYEDALGPVVGCARRAASSVGS